MKHLIFTLFSTIVLFAMAQPVSQRQLLPPKFPGGDEAMKQWIAENMNYPEEALNNKYYDQVTVTLNIAPSGWVDDVVVYRASEYEPFNEEAVRVCKTFPKFKPAMQNGVPIMSSIKVNVDFVLPENRYSIPLVESPDVEGLQHTPRVPWWHYRFIVLDIKSHTGPHGGDNILGDGKVVVSFIVKASGYVDDVKVVKSLYPAFDNEVVRVCRLLPRFLPATVYGQPVDMRYTLPVSLSFQ